MAAKYKLKKFVLDTKGVGEFAKSQGVLDAVVSLAETLSPGDGYSVHGEIAKTRAAAWISTSSEDSYRDNLKNNTLIKARNKGGGGYAH